MGVDPGGQAVLGAVGGRAGELHMGPGVRDRRVGQFPGRVVDRQHGQRVAVGIAQLDPGTAFDHDQAQPRGQGAGRLQPESGGVRPGRLRERGEPPWQVGGVEFDVGEERGAGGRGARFRHPPDDLARVDADDVAGSV